jgi:hypothetical protein
MVERLMNNVRAEMALANAQELMNVWTRHASVTSALAHVLLQKTNEKCFAKCVTKPGTSLSGSEQVCCHALLFVRELIWNATRHACLGVWTDTWKLVSTPIRFHARKKLIDHPVLPSQHRKPHIRGSDIQRAG